MEVTGNYCSVNIEPKACYKQTLLNTGILVGCFTVPNVGNGNLNLHLNLCCNVHAQDPLISLLEIEFKTRSCVVH